MASIFKKLFGSSGEENAESPDYIEVDVNQPRGDKEKITLRPFVLKKYEDINRILEVLREGSNIALIDIRALKAKDLVELKRAISKLKKTVDALEGNVTGFGENMIVVTPSFIEIYKGEQQPAREQREGKPSFY